MHLAPAIQNSNVEISIAENDIDDATWEKLEIPDCSSQDAKILAIFSEFKEEIPNSRDTIQSSSKEPTFVDLDKIGPYDQIFSPDRDSPRTKATENFKVMDVKDCAKTESKKAKKSCFSCSIL
jgi:hypothetical protein